MLIDQLHTFTDNLPVKVTGNSSSVAIMPFIGKGEHLNVAVCITEAYPTTATLDIAVQESSDNSTFTALQTVTVPKAKLNKPGVFNFVLPPALRGKFVRLAYTVGGAPATGKLWVGITGDTLEPMEAGLYINGLKKA